MGTITRLFILPVSLVAFSLTTAASTVTQTATGLEASQTVAWVPISVGDIFFIIQAGTGLPPDPGEIGKFTIQGVDSDGDGIRDDVERNISQYYPNNGMARAYSYMVAMNYQRMIENSSDQQIQIQIIQELAQVEDCLDQLLPDELEKGGNLVLPWVFNTYQRSYSYLDARGLMGGQILPETTGCQ